MADEQQAKVLVLAKWAELGLVKLTYSLTEAGAKEFKADQPGTAEQEAVAIINKDGHYSKRNCRWTRWPLRRYPNSKRPIANSESKRLR